MPNKYHGATHEKSSPFRQKPLSEKSEFRGFLAGNQNAHVVQYAGGIERNQRGFQQAALRTWKLIRK